MDAIRDTRFCLPHEILMLTYIALVSERDKVTSRLDEVGVLRGIRWAYTSAANQVYDDYSVAAGHDATWAGIGRFTYLRDRMDRVFACGNYAVRPVDDETVGLDVLHAKLSERDVRSFPTIDPHLVQRDDLNGSPGWSWKNYRWLLASATFGKIGELPWRRKSETKQRVARQPDPDTATLFDELLAAEVPGIAALFAGDQLDRDTFVVAHSHAIDHDGRELILGRPQLNVGGGSAWAWAHDLLAAPPSGGARRTPSGNGPDPVGPAPVADAPVRLRGREQSQPSKRDADGRR